MKRLIIFLIRIRLGLKKGQRFRFDNQKSKFDEYYFTDTELMKFEPKFVPYNDAKREIEQGENSHYRPSSVSLNWLLNNECKITKCESQWA
jgi:hypothetical protein